MAKLTLSETPSANLIQADTYITGDVFSGGNIRIDGVLKGNISCLGKTILGPTGRIEGNITSQNADIEGKVKGNVVVSELLSLQATAEVNGDIGSNKLAIEPGARFTGTCNINGPQNISEIIELPDDLIQEQQATA
jgi:cytoskeletal protein CcmA (bactofilin family)